jgi:hypothetical protein
MQSMQKDRPRFDAKKPAPRGGVINAIKHVFHKDAPKKQYEAGQNTSLKSALASALQAGDIKEEVKVEPEKVAPISLSQLKPVEKPANNPSDRSAGEDKMNALKNLIDKTQVEEKKEEVKPELPKVEPVKTEANHETPKAEEVKPKEVPEDVLRKILDN